MIRWVAAAVTVTLLAAGCSSSSTDSDIANTANTGDTTTTEPTEATVDSSQSDRIDSGDGSGRAPGEVTLIGSGVEPRDELRITADAQTRITVEASDSLTLTIDGATTEQAGNAGYQLDLDLSASGDTVQLLVVPTIESIDGPAPEEDEVGNWQWFLDAHGVVQRIVQVGWGDQVDDSTLGLLNVTNLVLVTPAEPVGAGATWSQSLNRQSDARLVFTLNEVSDTDLDVTIELVAPFEEGVATMAVTGAYDRNTLLARAVTTESKLEITSPVSENGELIELNGVQRHRRTYTEVTE